MLILLTNTSSRTKVLPTTGKLISPKDALKLEVTEEEFDLLQKTADLKIKVISTGESTPRTIFGEKLTIDKLNKKLERLEESLAEIFSRLAELETRTAHTLYKNLDSSLGLKILEQKVNYLLDLAEEIPRTSVSEMLNVEATPQESKRALFEKVVEQNQEIRES